MSPVKDSTSYITTESGSIDYAYYDKHARMARSNFLKGSLNALRGAFRKPRLRLATPAAVLGRGPVASPCG